MLEFVFVSMLLLLIIMAIIDFGHALFLRQAIVNASREGARYAVVYRVRIRELVNHLPPSNFSPTVQQVVTELPGRYVCRQVLIQSQPYRSRLHHRDLTGQQVTVTVNAYKTWFAVDALISFLAYSLANPLTLTAAPPCAVSEENK